MLEGSEYWKEVENIQNIFIKKYGRENMIMISTSHWTEAQLNTFKKDIKRLEKKLSVKKNTNVEEIGNKYIVISNNTLKFNENEYNKRKTCNNCNKLSFKNLDNYFLKKYNLCYKCSMLKGY